MIFNRFKSKCYWITKN